MKKLLARIFGAPQTQGAPEGALRLSSARFPRALYVIGDVHGRLDLLEALEQKIAAHAGMVDETGAIASGHPLDRRALCGKSRFS